MYNLKTQVCVCVCLSARAYVCAYACARVMILNNLQHMLFLVISQRINTVYTEY